MAEEKKLVTSDYILENETIETALKRLGIDIEANPDKYVVEYDGAMDDEYDNPLTSFSVYEVSDLKTHEPQTPEEELQIPEAGMQGPVEGVQNPEEGMQGPVEELQIPEAGMQGPVEGVQNPGTGSSDNSDVPSEDKENLEEETTKSTEIANKVQRKIIRVVHVAQNKAPVALIGAALLSILMQMVDIDIVQAYSVIENAMNNLHININEIDANFWDNYNLHDAINLGEGTSVYEVSNHTGDVATVGVSTYAPEMPYDISGVAVYDANGQLIDSLVDLHGEVSPVNIGEYVAQTCATHGIDPTTVDVSLHFGNEVDNSTLGWKNVNEVFPEFSIPQIDITVDPEATASQVAGPSKLDVNFEPDNINPVIPGALAAAAGASALATHKQNKEAENSPLYKEFETKEEYEQWKQNEYLTAKEEYEQKSFFGKLKSKLFSKKSRVQELSDEQVVEFDERVLDSLPDNIDLEHAEVKIKDDGHIIVDSREYVMNEDGNLVLVEKDIDATADAYNHGIAAVGKENQVIDTLPMTKLTASQIDEIAQISGRSK